MKNCPDCSVLISNNKKRCKRCALKAQKIIYTKTYNKRVTTGVRFTIAVCTECNQRFKRDKYSKGKPFCSYTCSGAYRYKRKQTERNQLFDKGELKFRNRIRVILLERFGHICQICKNTTWNNQNIPLQVDHIDGKSSNNNPSNLRLICHNCDALLPTFAGKNRGRGRKSLGLKTYE
jgi:hypothetical protein